MLTIISNPAFAGGEFDELDSAETLPRGRPDLNGADAWANETLYSMLLDGRTHARDKALLERFGVDGSVPYEQARINAGLPVAANDNEPMTAARAA